MPPDLPSDFNTLADIFGTPDDSEYDAGLANELAAILADDAGIPGTASEWLHAEISTSANQRGMPDNKTTLAQRFAQIRYPHPFSVQRNADARNAKATGNAEKYDRTKNGSPWTIFGGVFPDGHRSRGDAYQPSGLVFAELDNLPSHINPADARDEIFAHPAVIAACISFGGQGVHIIGAVNPAPTSPPQDSGAATYAAAWQAFVSALALPDTDESVKHPERIVYLPHDPHARIKSPNDPVEPVTWDMPALLAPAPATPAGPNSPTSADDPNPIPILPSEHRSVLDFTARFIVDHQADLVISTDAKDSKIYFADPETGLLEHGTGRVLTLIAQTCGDIVKEGFNAISPDGKGGMTEKAVAALARWLANLKRRETIALLDANAAGAIGLIRLYGLSHLLPEIHHPDQMDSNPRVWGCRNGLLDIGATPPAILHTDLARKMLVTANTGVNWNPRAQHPAVDKILPLAQSDIADYYGWALTHDQHRDCAAEISSPGSGKSTRRRAFRAAMGPDYVTTTREETLQVQRYNRGGTAHNSGVFAFRKPAKLTFVGDIEGKGAMNLPFINELTGDEVEIAARKPGESEVTFKANSHLILQGNHRSQGESLLGLSATDAAGTASDAFIDRLRVFDIPDIPVDQRDPDLRDQIQTAEFAEAMLVRLAYHANRMSDFGNVAPQSESMRQRLQAQIQSEKDTWITECLEPNILLNARNLDPNDAFAESNAGKPLDSYHLRLRLKDWWTDNETGRMPYARTITNAIIAIAGKPDRKSKVEKAGGGRADAQIWDRHLLAPED